MPPEPVIAPVQRPLPDFPLVLLRQMSRWLVKHSSEYIIDPVDGEADSRYIQFRTELFNNLSKELRKRDRAVPKNQIGPTTVKYNFSRLHEYYKCFKHLRESRLARYRKRYGKFRVDSWDGAVSNEGWEHVKLEVCLWYDLSLVHFDDFFVENMTFLETLDKVLQPEKFAYGYATS